MEAYEQMLALLAADQPTKAREFLAAWEERRNASFADAARDGSARAASSGHVAAIRGQLRYHLGEKALKESAASSGFGHLAMSTVSPGATFIAARVGRFALVSVNVSAPRRMLRKSSTRLELSQGNTQIERQRDLLASDAPPTVLAYLGCLASVPSRNDPTVPDELAFAVPNQSLTDWICWVPLGLANAKLVGLGGVGSGSPAGAVIPDNVLVKLRLPARDEASTEK